MDRSNHYEAAFEAYLRQRHLCYIAIDEARRSLLDEEPVKSLHFIVYGPGDARLLVDVKGRRFPGISGGKRRFSWECWADADDVRGLRRWALRFGAGYVGLLAFAYLLGPEVDLPPDVDDLWEFRGQRYLFRAVAIDDFARHMRVRSPKWGTVELPRADFRALVQPFCAFSGQALATVV